jgi:hypothetical protein
MKGFCEYGRIHQKLVAVAGTAAVQNTWLLSVTDITLT